MDVQILRPGAHSGVDVRALTPTQTPNEQYDSLEIGSRERLGATFKGFAVGAAIGGGVSAAAATLARLSPGPAPLRMLVQVGLGLAAGTGAIGALFGLAGARNFSQLAHQEAVQSKAVELAGGISAEESPTFESWSRMEELGTISKQPGLTAESLPLVRQIVESLADRGAEFVDCSGVGEAVHCLESGKPFTMNLEGRSTITSSQALLAFDVTRGAGTQALPGELRVVWERCLRSLDKLPGANQGGPRDKMEELLRDYADSTTRLTTSNAEFMTYSDIEHFDFLERGGPAPSQPHRALSFLAELKEKGYQLKEYSFDESWRLPDYDVYLGIRDNRHNNLLLDTPEGPIPIHLNGRIDESLASYEEEGLRNLAIEFANLKRSHAIPTDEFHRIRQADDLHRQFGGADDIPQWFSEGFAISGS